MLTRWIAAVRALLSRGRAHRETDEELQFHIEQETAANIDRGLAPAEARRAALRDLGGLTQTREAVFAVRSWRLEDLLQDVRSSTNSLRRTPGFSITAIAMLTLAIALGSAAFSIVSAVLFRDRGVLRPSELVHLYQVLPRYAQTAILSSQHRDLFAQRTDIFTDLAGFWAIPSPVSVGHGFGLRNGEQVTANYFDVLGVRPALGRTFGPAEDDLTTTEFAAVISHDLWIREFAGAPDAIGRQVEVRVDHNEARTFTIVGVAPQEFRGLSTPWRPTQFWVPVRQYWGAMSDRVGLGVVGRLREGVRPETALAAATVSYEQWWRDRMDRSSSDGVRAPGAVVPRGPNRLRVLPFDDVRIPLDPDAEVIPRRLALGLLLVVVLVLSVAIANVTGILRARGLARSEELAVRRALGAGLWRLVRQLATESVILALAAGAAGLLLAQWLVGLYRAFTPDRLLVPAALDLGVTAFTFTLAAGVGAVVAIGPALQAIQLDVGGPFGGRFGTTRRLRARVRHGVVIPQVALTALLLVTALVHLRSLAGVETADTGYGVDDVQVVRLGLASRLWADGRPPSEAERATEAERARRFYRLVEQRLASLGGVRRAALASELPTREVGSSQELSEYVARDVLGSGSQGALASTVQVSSGYFATLSIPLVRGRDFEAADTRGAESVAIVAASVERALWPTGSAIGKSIAAVRSDQRLEWLTVVGVVGDVTSTLQPERTRPLVYVPVSQQWWPSAGNLLVAVDDGHAAATAAMLSTDLNAIDAQAAVYSSLPLRSVVDELRYPQRAAATVLVTSAAVGLFLAGIGLYAVVSYSITFRLREIAIRMAVGASRRDVLKLVLREGATVAGIGLVLGLPASLGAVNLAASLISPVAASSPVPFLVVSGIIAVMTGGACAAASRRATAADPARLLRNA